MGVSKWECVSAHPCGCVLSSFPSPSPPFFFSGVEFAFFFFFVHCCCGQLLTSASCHTCPLVLYLWVGAESNKVPVKIDALKTAILMLLSGEKLPSLLMVGATFFLSACVCVCVCVSWVPALFFFAWLGLAWFGLHWSLLTAAFFVAVVRFRHLRA